MPNQFPDLTRQPPRSPRVRLGGYAVLLRILDKCRATLIKKNGEYEFGCPLDMRFFDFVGIDPKVFQKAAASGKGDGEMLAWIRAKAKHKRSDSEIACWSAHAEQRTASDTDAREYLNELHAKTAPKREDIVTWFDILDVDDYVSFGGKA